ncbi:MAG: PEPxxWA-CTERM sorting domain-containing protein [Caulobacteraceae bacterium]
MKIRHFMLGAATALSLGAAARASTTVTVDALTPFGSWLDTGLDLSAGTTYDFVVNDPGTIWGAGNDDPYPRESTANGIPSSVGYGTLTMDGFTANYGALVGDAGGTLFLIGTGPTLLSGLSGELTVGFWDDYYPDNYGTQSLSISVPEPATWALMLGGFGALCAALRLARRRTATLA